ncbi:anti-sigma-I factor RsgI2-like [Sciurus carolinensis]|uniref:anti-sigma-I factor RsgI2-like n=1 Tax=Sciurus carolinensis TaxID=30640 RepID=UPI001FB37166|nr:anti-sigma-I factor RsgI2-like [Sciurus carolinensis]
MYKRWTGSEHPKPLGISTPQSLLNSVASPAASPAQNVSAEAKAVCSPTAVLPPTPAVLPPTPAVLPPASAVLPPNSAVETALPASTQVPTEVPTPSAVPEVQAEVSPWPVTRSKSPEKQSMKYPESASCIPFLICQEWTHSPLLLDAATLHTWGKGSTRMVLP